MRLSRLALATALTALAPVTAHAAITFQGKFEVAADAIDLSGQGAAGGADRLSFGSDWVYSGGSFYGITDRGPGGGLLPFVPRVHKLSLGIDTNSGAVTGYEVTATTLFRDTDGSFLNGLTPDRLPGGSAGVLGKSFDSEGFALLPNGNYLVADEYGPSVYEFNASGVKLRAYEVPANIVPKLNGSTDYVTGAGTSGRQDNRGYEGLTISQDGTKAYAILQDPLFGEGPGGLHRRGRFLRIVEFDTATGQSTGQYAYQLESLADINARIPGTADDFGQNAQGRNIGVSSITSLGDGSFLVIERDNRGLGVEENGALPPPIGTKRVFRIRLDGATDIGEQPIVNGVLPAGAVAVSKSLYLDVQLALEGAGMKSVEKLEGLTFGPMLADGSLALYIVSDNDFSVTQSGAGDQFDVCVKPGVANASVAIGTACPDGFKLIPTTIYAFKVTGLDAVGVVPEPATWAMMIGGFGLVGAAMRRRRLQAATA